MFLSVQSSCEPKWVHSLTVWALDAAWCVRKCFLNYKLVGLAGFRIRWFCLQQKSEMMLAFIELGLLTPSHNSRVIWEFLQEAKGGVLGEYNENIAFINCALRKLITEENVNNTKQKNCLLCKECFCICILLSLMKMSFGVAGYSSVLTQNVLTKMKKKKKNIRGSLWIQTNWSENKTFICVPFTTTMCISARHGHGLWGHDCLEMSDFPNPNSGVNFTVGIIIMLLTGPRC